MWGRTFFVGGGGWCCFLILVLILALRGEAWKPLEGGGWYVVAVVALRWSAVLLVVLVLLSLSACGQWWALSMAVLCVAGSMGDGMSSGSGSGNRMAGLAGLRSSVSVSHLRIMTMARSTHRITCQASECISCDHVLDHGM